jgi:Cytosolic domain of 10TM putative phosphate transporter
MYKEFTWFTEFRHKYLRKAKARNFSIFVRNIPVEYCSNAGLEYFFKHCFGPEHVVETRIRVKAPSLQTQVANRDKLLTKFAHALAYEELTNREYMVKKSVLSGTRERVLETTSRELKASNEDICNRINAIEAKTNVTGASPIIFDVTSVAGNCVGDISVFDDSVAADQHQNSTEASVQLDKATGTVPNQDITVDESSGSGLKLISNALKGISETTKGVASGALDVAASSLNLLNNNEDGEFYDAGFVSFSNLCTTNAALQMVHHSTPFDVEVMAAPDPEDSEFIPVLIRY